MGQKVLQAEDVQKIKDCVDSLAKGISEYQQRMTTVINSFNKEGIVQSFYEVGNFGMAQKEKMQKLLAAINEFYELMNKEKGLIAGTKEYADSARRINETGKDANNG